MADVDHPAAEKRANEIREAFDGQLSNWMRSSGLPKGASSRQFLDSCESHERDAYFISAAYLDLAKRKVTVETIESAIPEANVSGKMSRLEIATAIHKALIEGK